MELLLLPPPTSSTITPAVAAAATLHCHTYLTNEATINRSHHNNRSQPEKSPLHQRNSGEETNR